MLNADSNCIQLYFQEERRFDDSGQFYYISCMTENTDDEINIDGSAVITETEKDSQQPENNAAENTEQKKRRGRPRGKKNRTEKTVSAPENSIISADQMLPPKLTLIPLQGRPIFPGIFTPLMINSPEDIKAIEETYSHEGFLGISMIKDSMEDNETPSVADLCTIGTAARIIKKVNMPDGGLNIFISTVKRFKIRKTLHPSVPMVAAVEYLDDEEDRTFEVKALTRAIISEMKEISDNNPLFSEEMRLNMVNIDNPGKIADFITSILNIDRNEQQKILETVNVRQRMEQVLVFIKREQELLRVQKKIQAELNERVEKNQREYFLREELKSIQEELGTNADGEASDYQKFKEKIKALEFSGEIKETVDGELEKFNLMDPNSAEYIGTRNFLELVTQLPWKDGEKPDFSMEKARETLDRDHFGLEDVKKRILEYLAVSKMKGDSKGSILLLVGPPGVGKTSVGKSVAAAMNKPFYRFSVGGMRDEAEIKGHRRTYIGAMPGKIIQGLKITKSKSPVFMIDEIDKMGSSHQGDPASALLEVLDPEQNVSFRDNYLDLPFDISNVLFILTANTLDSIPSPLLDRAEIIQIAGYIDQEKIEIAKKYLIPKNLIKNGLKKNQVRYTKDALLTIAEEYARESGVRNFKKSIDKIHRKIVAELVNEAEKNQDKAEQADTELGPVSERKFTVETADLDKYLGKPVFDESEIKKASVPGTAIGLAWTSMGGDTLLIEASEFEGKGGLVLTGQMGDVMKESCQIAFNWSRKFITDRKIRKPDWFDKHTVHLHIPEGATPKDGPSAGITMATAFISLMTGKTIKPNLAMTGELSLTGQVLPIGGLREKTVAAKRNKIRTIIIPKANSRDLDDIPENVRAGITFIPVTRAEEVISFVLPKIKDKTTVRKGRKKAVETEKGQNS